MHLHSWHVHIEIELHVADIRQLVLCIAEFDQDFIVTLAKLALRMNEIYSQVVHRLTRKRRAGNFVGRKFFPEEITRVKQDDHDADKCNPP